MLPAAGQSAPTAPLTTSNLDAVANGGRLQVLERRVSARPQQLEPSIKTTRLKKEEEAELLQTTVVVSCRPQPSAESAERAIPFDIHLHQEEVFVRYPPAAASAPTSPTGPPMPSLEPAQQEGLFSDTLLLPRPRYVPYDSDQLAMPGPSPLATSLCQRLHHQRNSHHHHPHCHGNGDDDVVRRAASCMPVHHEQDHDCCPFTALRRDERMLRLVDNIARTSPYDWKHLLSSFSIKNAFMFYPPPPTYCFVRDERGEVQVRSQTGKRAPQLDRERIEYIRRQRRLPHSVPDDLVGGALHGIASAEPGDLGVADDRVDPTEPSFELVFIPSENTVQSYFIRAGSVIFGHKVQLGRPHFSLRWSCPIPCSIIRPHRRMSSHICLFFHCNGEDIGRPSCMRLLTLANALHMTIFVPEYPGYGLCEGHPSEASIKGCMERVVQFLFTVDPSLTPSRVILMGHSIGTGVAVHIADFIQRVYTELRRWTVKSGLVSYACPASFDPADASDKSGDFAERPRPRHTGMAEAEESVGPHEPIGHASDATRYDRERTRAPGVSLPPPRPHAALPCRHYALGGIILLSPLPSVRCIEHWSTLRQYGLNVHELERRRLTLREDVLMPAPQDWAQDAREVLVGAEGPPTLENPLPPPFIFSLARFISFNRFPSIDVMCKLQRQFDYFNTTPLLLLHGAQDVLVPPLHSVAIATMLRQCATGADAKMYLGVLKDGGHNNLQCAHIIRRFYKDIILMPHLRRQKALHDGLEETLGHGVELQHVQQQQPHQTQPADLSHSTATALVETEAHSVTAQHRAPLDSAPEDVAQHPANAAHEHGEEADGPDVEVRQAAEPAGGTDDHAVHPPVRTSDEESSGSLPQHKEPYLYFIEPASDDGAAERGGGSRGLAGGPAEHEHPHDSSAHLGRSLRVHLLHSRPPGHAHHPAPPNSTEEVPAATLSAAAPAHDANVFNTRQARAYRNPSDILFSPPICALTPPAPPGPHEDGSLTQMHFKLTDPSQTTTMMRGAHHSYGVSVDASRGDAAEDDRLRSAEAQASESPTRRFEGALRNAVHRTQPPHTTFAPAATMLHIALFSSLDHYDVGSIAVASVTRYSLDTSEALRIWSRYRRNAVIVRCLVAVVYFALGSFYISVAIFHSVLTRPSHLRKHLPAGADAHEFRHDARVIVWGVLDGSAYLVLGVVLFYHYRLGLGNLSRYFRTPRALVLFYTVVRLLAYAVCLGAGIFMAMILALTPSNRGGVPWQRWSALPYSQRVWISYLPRWTMIGSATLHTVMAVFILLKNH